MSSSGSYPVSATAYAKIVLHAAKFPSESVGGFLLGTVYGGITDVVPVFHETPVGPILSTAAQVVDSMWAGKADEQIIGFYLGSRMATVGDVACQDPFYLEAVMKEIRRNTDQNALLLRVENDRLAGENRDLLCVTVMKGGKRMECKPIDNGLSNKDMNSKVTITVAVSITITSPPSSLSP